jgi:transposase
VHIWGCIGDGFRSLVILREGEKLDKQAYIRRILQKVVPELKRRNLTFLQDGAACHRAAIPYLKSKGVKLVENYPPRSPDFNVIEMLWARLQRDVWALRPTSRRELESSVRQAWDAIPEAFVLSLLRGWRNRLQIAAANGGAQ